MKKILFLFILVTSFLFFKVDFVKAQACTGLVKCSAYIGEPVNDCSQDQSWLNTYACDGPGCTAGGECTGGCEISNSCAPSGPVIPGATPTPRPGSLENCPAGQVITAYDPPAYTCPASGCNSVFREATGNSCGPGGAYEECEVLYCAVPATPTPAPQLPLGFHAITVDCTLNSGWTCDPDNFNQALTVTFTDGPMGSASIIGTATANVDRGSGLAPYCGGTTTHGFLFDTPQSMRDGLQHMIYAYATNLGGGQTYQLLNTSPVTFTCSTPTPTPTPVPTPTPSPTPLQTANPTPAPCFVTTSPVSASLSVGGTKGVTASVSSGLGSASVTNMQFGSYEPAIASVNPDSDTTSPTYSTTVTAVSSGSTAVWATATLSDDRICESTGSTDTNISVTDICTPPVIVSFERVSYNKFKINWTHGACDGNQQVVITQDGNPIVNVTLPSTDTTYTTGNVLAPGSVYEVEIINSDSLGNETTSNSTNPAPYVDTPQLYLSSCALSPLSSQLQVSQSATITSSVDSSPQINRVEFTSSNPSVVSVTSPDSTVPYTTQVTAVGAGSAVISSKVYFDNGVLACDTNVDGGNSSINVIDLANSWWQLKDSDISSNGSLNSSVPVGNVFILPGAGGSSGIPAYSTTTNITTTNASNDHWICQNDNKSKPVFDYSYFEDLIPSDVTINNIGSPSVPCSTFASGGTASYGYYWYRYDGGSGHIPLHINSSCSIGDRKVVVLVKDADLFIDGSINLNDGVGFFMGIVDQSINVDPSVGGGSGPNLEGFFITDNEFHSGAGTNSLEVRGAVVAYDGIILERDLGAGNATTPAELFEYGPDQSLLFPSKLATRKISWKEVAP